MARRPQSSAPPDPLRGRLRAVRYTDDRLVVFRVPTGVRSVADVEREGTPVAICRRKRWRWFPSRGPKVDPPNGDFLARVPVVDAGRPASAGRRAPSAERRAIARAAFPGASRQHLTP